MNIHEYQGKEIFRSMGVAFQKDELHLLLKKQWKRLKNRHRDLCG